MAWVGGDLKDHEAPTPLSLARPPTSIFNSRPGCPGPHPPPGMDGASTASLGSLKVVNAPFLEALKARLDVPLGSLI